MQTSIANRLSATPLTPIEQFLRDYLEARGGMWDEIEPQVYDVLLEPDLLRVAFDPEALPEHPQAQLAAFGSPLLDRLLCDAGSRWNSAACYRIGLHLAPFNLEARIAQTFSLSPGATIELLKSRAMYFPQAVFWFKATFTSDQKEDAVLPIGIDLHQLREVRQLDGVLEFDRLSREPETPLPEAPHRGLIAGYRLALANAARSVGALANARRRDWSGTLQKQIGRMRGYYQRQREEAAASTGRTADPAAAEARRQDRHASIVREEALRIAELQRKAELRVQIKLVNLLTIYQPKLLLQTRIRPKSGDPLPLHLVWDPQLDLVEAATCPNCAKPTFQLQADRWGIRCPGCAAGTHSPKSPHTRR